MRDGARVRANGENQNIKTKPQTNEQILEFKGETRIEYKQRRIRVQTKARIEHENELTVEAESQH